MPRLRIIFPAVSLFAAAALGFVPMATDLSAQETSTKQAPAKKPAAKSVPADAGKKKARKRA